jgi:mannose-6-phosphate isomerase-like protein (cupin superfamily)
MKQNKRPWGEYEIISQTKILKILPNSSLSLQYHKERDEYWKVLEGEGIITIEDEKYNAKKGDQYLIKRGEKHRIITNNKSIKILEISCGKIDEEDIIRLEDNYGRK